MERAITGYAVIDVETTGLAPRRDRVVDLCVVLLDTAGEEEEVISTLVSTWPLQATAPAEAFQRAPTFADLAPFLADCLDCRIPVGHNVRFDLALLAAEYRRVGVELRAPTYVDTMELDRRLVPNADGRSLTEVAARLGLGPFNWHTAEGDTRATAEVFRVQLRELRQEFHKGEGISLHPMPAPSTVHLEPRDPLLFPPTTKIRVPEADRSEPSRPPVRMRAGDESDSEAADRVALEETIQKLNEQLSVYLSSPEIQAQLARKDALLAGAGLPNAEGLEEIWRQGNFRGHAGLEAIDQVIAGWRLVKDPELPDALFTKLKCLSQLRRLDDGIEAMTELVQILLADEDECLSTEVLYWLEGHPGWLLTWFPELLPLFQDDEEKLDDAFWVLLGAAEKAGESDFGLAELLLSYASAQFGGDSENRLRVLRVRFDIYKRRDPAAATTLVLNCWPEADAEMASFAVKSLANSGEVSEALRFGREALNAFSDHPQLRATVGRVYRSTEELD